jgi:ApaG protein
MFSKTTHNITITATPQFLADHSEPAEGHYVWAYTIQLENNGTKPVKLLNRHWKITDASGLTQEVRGTGVIGEQPILEPGESYEYTSGAALATASGMMLGEYEMTETETGQHFDVEIPAFSLDSPYQMRRMN